MSELVAESRVMSERLGGHLDPSDVAAYIDRVVEPSTRHRIEAHLASCAECRDELVDATRILATLPRRHRVSAWIAATAAAAIVFMLVLPRDTRDAGTEHREAPVTATVAPQAVSPVGFVDSAPTLRWTSVPHADRYQVRIFSAGGSVLWERETNDTTIAVPDSVGVRAGRAYYWKVEAQAGFDRRAASELIEFSVRFPQRR